MHGPVPHALTPSTAKKRRRLPSALNRRASRICQPIGLGSERSHARVHAAARWLRPECAQPRTLRGSDSVCAHAARPTGGGHTCTCSKNTAPTRTRRDMTDQPVAESYMKPVDHGLRPHGHPARHLHDGADGPAPGRSVHA
jgi:hypothetical protein